MVIVRVIYFAFVLFFSSVYAENIRQLQVFYDAMLTANKASVLQSNVTKTMYYLNDYGNYNFFVYASSHFEGHEDYGDNNSSIIGVSGGSNINAKRFYSYGLYYTNYSIGNSDSFAGLSTNLDTENIFIVLDYKQVYNMGTLKPFVGFSATIHWLNNSGASQERLEDPNDPMIINDYNVFHDFNNVLISPNAYFNLPVKINSMRFLVNRDIALESNFKFRTGLDTISPFSYRQQWYFINDVDETEDFVYNKYSKIKMFYAFYFDLGFDMVFILNKMVIKYDFSYRNYAGRRESKNLALSVSDGSPDEPYSIDYKNALAYEITNTLSVDLNLITFFVGSLKKGRYRSSFLGVKLKINEF